MSKKYLEASHHYQRPLLFLTWREGSQEVLSWWRDVNLRAFQITQNLFSSLEALIKKHHDGSILQSTERICI